MVLNSLPQEETNQINRVCSAINVPIAHCSLGADVPLAVSIETKSLNGDELTGASQLAAWARAQFRHLDSLVSGCQALRQFESQQDTAADVPDLTSAWSAAQERPNRRSDKGSTMDLPVLPLLLVRGQSWRVDFARRAQGKTVS